MGLPFDRITWMLETLLTPEIRQRVYAERAAVVDRWQEQCVGASREKTNELLLEAARACDDDLSSICPRHSADLWLSLVRRVPPSVFAEAWSVHATLAILKYSSWTHDTTAGSVHEGDTFGVVLRYTSEDMKDAWRIVVDAALIARVLQWRRVCSKGGRIVRDETRLRLDVPEDVRNSIDEYERRRPSETHSGDDAVPMTLLGDVERAILYLAPLEKPLPLFVPKANFTLTLAHLPMLLPFDSLRRALRFYDEPLLDRYGAGAEAILQVFVGLSAQCLHAFPPLEMASPDGWRTDADPSSDSRVAFLFGLLQKGFVRFPREHLEQALSNVIIDLLPGPREEWVHAFFDAFVLKPEAREGIDVLSLELPPIAWVTPGGHCYFDLVLFDDFIRTLLTSAREWYSTAHGDRFHLLLKMMIEAGAPEAAVVGAKRKVVTAAEEVAVPDLLVRSGRVLYVVECKAFSKSRAFWRGDLEALYQRTRRIAEAVGQAQQAAAVVTKALHDGTLEVEGVEQVQWAVCGPSQEFLLPPDRYGVLAPDVPRVCTHEEFVSVLRAHGSAVA